MSQRFYAHSVPSAALQEFVTSSVSEGTLASSGKGVDTALTALQHTLLHGLQPALEQLVFRLSELNALARWKERYAQLGVEVRRLVV